VAQESFDVMMKRDIEHIETLRLLRQRINDSVMTQTQAIITTQRAGKIVNVTALEELERICREIVSEVEEHVEILAIDVERVLQIEDKSKVLALPAPKPVMEVA
jgi:hypothetical protein